MPDTKCLHTISEYGSVSRVRKTKADFCLHEDALLNIIHEENGRHHYLVEEDMPVLLLPNLENKSLNKKTLKRLTTLPYSKRPKSEQQNGSVMTAEIGYHDDKKARRDHVRSISDDKCGTIKQKRAQDSKKIEKKNFKASVKTKFDPFPSKAGIIIPDSAFGGISATVHKAGIYGLRSGLHDVTKYMEELSLDDLLDGSYQYSNKCVEKRKKASNGNENILLSVRNACSILQLREAVDSGGKIKALTSPQNSISSTANMSDGEEKDNCGGKLSKKDFCQANFGTSPLYQPQDVLGRLSLPLPLDLEALKLNFNPSQCTLGNKVYYSISLPPFSWSSPQGGTCKSGVDSCKFNQPVYQSKWVRIGNHSTRGDNNGLSGLGVKTRDLNDVFADQQKIDDLLQYVNKLAEPIVTSMDDSHVVGDSNSIKGASASGLFESGRLELLDVHDNASDNHMDNYSEDYLFRHNSKTEVDLTCLGNELDSMNPRRCDSSKDNEIGLEECPERITDDSSGSCFGYPCKSSHRHCEQISWCSPETLKAGNSPEVLSAAAILCDIANSSNALRQQNDTYERQQKDHKPSPLEKTERLTLAPRHHVSFKQTGLPSMKRKMIGETGTEFLRSHNVDRESAKRSLFAEAGGASRDCARENQSLLHQNSTRPSGLMQPPMRGEKAYDNHPRHGKETLKGSWVGFREDYVNNWSRGRSKRDGNVHYPNTRDS